MSVIHSNLSNRQLTGERFGDIERPSHLFPFHGTAAAEATSMVGRLLNKSPPETVRLRTFTKLNPKICRIAGIKEIFIIGNIECFIFMDIKTSDSAS